MVSRALSQTSRTSTTTWPFTRFAAGRCIQPTEGHHHDQHCNDHRDDRQCGRRPARQHRASRRLHQHGRGRRAHRPQARGRPSSSPRQGSSPPSRSTAGRTSQRRRSTRWPDIRTVNRLRPHLGIGRGLRFCAWRRAVAGLTADDAKHSPAARRLSDAGRWHRRRRRGARGAVGQPVRPPVVGATAQPIRRLALDPVISTRLADDSLSQRIDRCACCPYGRSSSTSRRPRAPSIAWSPMTSLQRWPVW